MPRGQYTRRPRTEAITPTSGNVVSLITAAQFEQLAWWKKLNEQEQHSIVNESQQLAGALQQFGQSRLAIGLHLAKLRDVLEPHKLFDRFLKNFHFSRRTAYRYITKYRNAQQLPAPVLEVAMVKGMDVGGETDDKPFGLYTDAIRRLPPPATTATQEQVLTYLTQLDDVRKQTRLGEATGAGLLGSLPTLDPKQALKQSYLTIHRIIQRLPNNTRTRANFVRALVGMIMSDLGLQGHQSFTAEPIPADFAPARRGRPGQTVAAA